MIRSLQKDKKRTMGAKTDSHFELSSYDIGQNRE
jgi:hypothetical protein